MDETAKNKLIRIDEELSVRKSQNRIKSRIVETRRALAEFFIFLFFRNSKDIKTNTSDPRISKEIMRVRKSESLGKLGIIF